MSLDLEALRPEMSRVPTAISRREGVLISLVVHGVALAIWAFAPVVPQAQPAALPLQPTDKVTYVAIEPRVELPALAKLEAPPSDRDRRVAAPDAAVVPANDQPRSVGDTPDKVLATPPPDGTGADAGPPAPPAPPAAATTGVGDLQPPPVTKEAAAPGLGASLRNLQQFLQQQNYQNPDGGQAGQSADIQFDSKGVDFGPWLRRFRAQVYRNWFVPQIFDKGRVVIQFSVHRDGRITDINVIKPAAIETFTISAVNALRRSNPLVPLPAEFPDDRIQFTVTFIYNERIDR